MFSKEQCHIASEGARFIRTISQGMCHRVGEDVDDGFGNIIASCTLSRTIPHSEAKL